MSPARQPIDSLRDADRYYWLAMGVLLYQTGYAVALYQRAGSTFWDALATWAGTIFASLVVIGLVRLIGGAVHRVFAQRSRQ